jgi:hypothetical protein
MQDLVLRAGPPLVARRWETGEGADAARLFACRDFRQRAVFADRSTRQAAKASGHALEFAGLHQPRQGDRRQTLLRHVSRSQQRSGACRAQRLLFVGGRGCCDGRGRLAPIP